VNNGNGIQFEGLYIRVIES